MAESAAAVAAPWQTYRGRRVTGAIMTFAGQFGDGRRPNGTRSRQGCWRGGLGRRRRTAITGNRVFGTRQHTGTRDCGGDGITRRPVRARIDSSVQVHPRAVRCACKTVGESHSNRTTTAPMMRTTAARESPAHVRTTGLAQSGRKGGAGSPGGQDASECENPIFG